MLNVNHKGIFGVSHANNNYLHTGPWSRLKDGVTRWIARAVRLTRRLTEPLRHGVLYGNTLATHKNNIVLV